MADFTIDARPLKKLEQSLAREGKDFKKGVKRFLKEVGVYIYGFAVKYAPRSPTKQQYERTLKSGKTRRRGSSFHPGQLEESVTWKAKKDRVSIFVPSNSKAGKYAEKIHDKKGSEWHKRGVGTKAKGDKADEKYIYRAYDKSVDKVDELIDKVISDMVKGIGV